MISGFLFYKEKIVKLIILNLVFVTEIFKNGMITLTKKPKN